MGKKLEKDQLTLPLEKWLTATPILRPRKKDLENGQDLSYLCEGLILKISPRAKRIALRLDSTKRVMNLVVPNRFNLKKAEDFVLEHKEWIEKKLHELPSPITFSHGSTIPVLGRTRLITIAYNNSMKSTRIQLKDNELYIETNQTDPSLRIVRFLKKEAKDTLTNLAKEKAAELGEPLQAVQIRDTKSRWGSCGPDARISLSWRLIFAPWEAMDYVVAHEVAHLRHLDHSRNFWILCESLSEDYDFGKKWMKNSGNELMRYGL